MKPDLNLRSIRRMLLAFMIFLFLSGVTAIPVGTELSFLLVVIPEGNLFYDWLNLVRTAWTEVAASHPFLLYGYDWLAFAHFLLAILFIGPYADPVKNIWVIQFGMIACVLVFPLALIAGPLRGIPLGWRLIDCSFGLLAFPLLYNCYRQTKKLSIFFATPNNQ